MENVESTSTAPPEEATAEPSAAVITPSNTGEDDNTGVIKKKTENVKSEKDAGLAPTAAVPPAESSATSTGNTVDKVESKEVDKGGEELQILPPEPEKVETTKAKLTSQEPVDKNSNKEDKSLPKTKKDQLSPKTKKDQLSPKMKMDKLPQETKKEETPENKKDELSHKIEKKKKTPMDQNGKPGDIEEEDKGDNPTQVSAKRQMEPDSSEPPMSKTPKTEMMHRLILTRMADTALEQLGGFTGWMDEEGAPNWETKFEEAGRIIKAKGFRFDKAFAAGLLRGFQSVVSLTYWMGQKDLKVEHAFELNQRHFGDITGLARNKAIAAFGANRVNKWSSTAIGRPPPLELENLHRVKVIEGVQNWLHKATDELPDTESFADVILRSQTFYDNTLAPCINLGARLLIVASQDSIRGIMSLLSDISTADILRVVVPVGMPVMYKLDAETMRPLRLFEFLGNTAEAKAANQAVADVLLPQPPPDQQQQVDN